MTREEGFRWLGKAEENLKLASLALIGELYALSCFHSQQAAEFSLKGLLIGLAGVHLVTHSLVRLTSEARASAVLDLPFRGRTQTPRGPLPAGQMPEREDQPLQLGGGGRGPPGREDGRGGGWKSA